MLADSLAGENPARLIGSGNTSAFTNTDANKSPSEPPFNESTRGSFPTWQWLSGYINIKLWRHRAVNQEIWLRCLRLAYAIRMALIFSSRRYLEGAQAPHLGLGPPFSAICRCELCSDFVNQQIWLLTGHLAAKNVTCSRTVVGTYRDAAL